MWRENGGTLIGRQPSDTSRADSAQVTTVASYLELAMDSVRVAGHYPLFVFTAGNDSIAPINAWWSGYPATKLSSYASQILVVGADTLNSSSTGTLSQFSDTGSLVDLVAPGSKVLVIAYDQNNSPILGTVSGTSYSAPYVAGAAGQLVSFDPTLQGASLTATDSIKSYLIRGSVDGGRTAGGYAVLNAYLALRRAARRHGGRLCGNYMYSDTLGHLYVVRNDSDSTADELLTTTTSGWPSTIDPAHGSNYILFKEDSNIENKGPQVAVTYTDASGWGSIQSGFTPPDTLWHSASYLNSAVGRSHDGEDTVVASAGTGQHLNRVNVHLTNSAGWSITTNNPPTDILASFDADGDSVYISYATYDHAAPDSNFTTYVWKVASNGPAGSTALRTLPDTEVWNFGPREDGTGFWDSQSYGWDNPPNCTVRYRDATWSNVFRSVASQYTACYTYVAGVSPSAVRRPSRATFSKGTTTPMLGRSP